MPQVFYSALTPTVPKVLHCTVGEGSPLICSHHHNANNSCLSTISTKRSCHKPRCKMTTVPTHRGPIKLIHQKSYIKPMNLVYQGCFYQSRTKVWGWTMIRCHCSLNHKVCQQGIDSHCIDSISTLWEIKSLWVCWTSLFLRLFYKWLVWSASAMDAEPLCYVACCW